MAKKTYIGVDDIARRVKKIYIGGDNVAHIVKKAYIGVGGVARPFLSSDILEYYGAITGLNSGYQLAATSVGNYALFGGGYNGSNLSSVSAYDTSLTRTTPTSLSQARRGLAATSVGSYALFGGGSGNIKVVDAYNTSLTRTTPTSLSQTGGYLAATSVGNYALFGGGYYNGSVFSSVSAYDISLTRTTPTSLSQARYNLAATSIGNYALFSGGFDDSNVTSVVDAYDTSLTRTIPTSLSQARTYLAATSVGNYALFGGGSYNSNFFSVVDAYDISLTRTTPTSLSQARRLLAATSTNNCALFAGGYNSSATSSVDAYNAFLTRTTPTSLSRARYELAATSVGDYALFGGGWDSKYYLSTLDAYIDNVPCKIVSWADGTDEEIIAMVAAADAGKINLADYWAVGDTRSVNLSAMSATSVGESHEAQTAEFVLMDTTCQGFTITATGKKPSFIVGMKNCLAEAGYMNRSSTTSGGWSGSQRRAWCNNVFYNAVPSTLRNIFKQFTWQQGEGDGATSGLLTTQDYFGLAPEAAIFGPQFGLAAYSQSDERSLYSQWTWYATSSNRTKTISGSAVSWWECSTCSGYSTYFCCVNNYANVHCNGASTRYGLAPFGCI